MICIERSQKSTTVIMMIRMTLTETTTTRMWSDAQRDGGHAKYRCHKWGTKVLKFPSLSHATKFGWCPLLECRAVTLPILENARLGHKVNFAYGKIQLGGKSTQQCIYSVPAQKTAKHRTKFAWRPLSDNGAVKSQDTNPFEISWGAKTR